MADWFVTVLSPVDQVSDDLAEVFECIDYREAVRLAHTLADDDRLTVEVLDYEGRIVRALGLDEWDGTQGWSAVPRRAGVYRWQAQSETYREVMR